MNGWAIFALCLSVMGITVVLISAVPWRHITETVRLLAKHPLIPRWLKAMIVFGCLPILGPFDEVVLVIAAVICWVRYRESIKAAWWVTREVSRNTRNSYDLGG